MVVGGGVAMEVLGGVVIVQNFGHVKDGAAPSNPPHHSLLCGLKHTICHPFEDWQIMELVGVVLVVFGLNSHQPTSKSTCTQKTISSVGMRVWGANTPLHRHDSSLNLP